MILNTLPLDADRREERLVDEERMEGGLMKLEEQREPLEGWEAVVEGLAGSV